MRENAWEVQQTTDGGYIIVGETESFGNPGLNVWLLKTDSLGDTLWTRTFGGQSNDRGYSVQETTDGGYVVVGYTVPYGLIAADVYLVKTNSLGDTLWTRTYGGTHDEIGRSVKQTSDGGYIIAGTKAVPGSQMDDVFILKTNSFGDTLWTKTYGVTNRDQGFSVHQLADNGYMVAAYTYYHCGGGIWFIRMDSTGDTLWTKVYNHPIGVAGKSCRPTSDGGYIATGVNYNGDIWLIKLDSFGDSLWTQSYGGPAEDWGFDVLETAGKRYVLTGKTGSWGANPPYDVFLIKTDSLGNRVYTQCYDRDSEDYGHSLQQTADSGFIIVGRTTSNNFDIYLIKTGAYPGIDEQTTIAIKQCRQGTTIFSGPLQLPKGIQCKVFDITGRVVLPDKIRPGIYFIEIDGRITQKVVKIR